MHNGTNLLRVRDYNQQLVLNLIRLGNGASRVEIAERTGLAAQTVTNIVRRLLDDGLVVEAGKGTASRSGGKRRVKLRINSDAGYSVGVQLDREEISLLLLDLNGRARSKSRFPNSPAAGPLGTVDRAADAVRRLLKGTGVPAENILGVGVASPGPLDHEAGVVYDPPGFEGWGEVHLKEMLEERLGYPVAIDNDVVAAAVGEHWLGVAQDVGNFAFVYMGGGLGAGLFFDGRAYRGSTGTAGEISHVPLDPDGPECWCGNRGCLARFCSPRDVVAVVARDLERGQSSSLRVYFDGQQQKDIDFEAVCRAALAGDALASKALGRAARMLGNALVGLVNTLDVNLVVLGGKNFEQAGRLYAGEIERAIHERVLYGHRRKVEVRSSRFGEDTGAVGAASLVLYSAFAPQLRGLPAE